METEALPQFAAVEVCPPPAASRRFGAGRALAIYLLVQAAQFVLALIIVIPAAIVADARHVNAAQAMQGLDVVLLVLSFVAGAIVFYGLARSWTPLWLRDQRASGFGSVRLELRHVVVAAACGFAIATAYPVVSELFGPPTDIGPAVQPRGPFTCEHT